MEMHSCIKCYLYISYYNLLHHYFTMLYLYNIYYLIMIYFSSFIYVHHLCGGFWSLSLAEAVNMLLQGGVDLLRQV